jgi:hypothetical protein
MSTKAICRLLRRSRDVLGLRTWRKNILQRHGFGERGGVDCRDDVGRGCVGRGSVRSVTNKVAIRPAPLSLVFY